MYMCAHIRLINESFLAVLHYSTHLFIHVPPCNMQLGDIFTIHVAGKYMTFVTDPEDFPLFFQNKNVDFQKAVQPYTKGVGTCVCVCVCVCAHAHVRVYDMCVCMYVYASVHKGVLCVNALVPMAIH